MRNEQIYNYVNRGKKQTDVGRMYHLSRQRIGQIWYREEVNMQKYIENNL